jgi:membrane fusion protein, type I secretion system
MSRSPRSARSSLRRHLFLGLGAAIILAGGVGGWAGTAEIAGAVIAPGSLVVDSNIKKVQHLSGGIVGELFVRDGDQVEAGALLVRLDETITRANLAIIVKSLDEFAARQARLEAERDDAGQLIFPEDLSMRAPDAAVLRVMEGERRLFELRRAARAGQKEQLNERILQIEELIRGTEEQVAAKTDEITFINQELEGVRDLWRKKLIPITRVTALERDAARLRGERGALVSSIAQAKGKITETQLQILQIDQDLRSEVSKELAEIRAKTSELTEKRVAAEDSLKRIDIRAPQAGRVHQLAVHTVGGVISAGEAIMLIVRQRNCPPRRTQAGARHAARDLHPDRRAHRDLVSGQADHRTAQEGLARAVRACLRDENTRDGIKMGQVDLSSHFSARRLMTHTVPR